MISIVVPVFNEEEVLEIFYKEVIQVIPSLDKEYEIVFIDDGSTDKSLEKLKKITKESQNLRVFSLRKNLGKAEALACGFSKARGDYIITLDADLQDKPTEIYKLLKKCKEGTEVVCGWRKDRKDKPRMVVISKMFNSILNSIFDVHIHDYNCGLKVYTKEAAKSLHLYGGLHRFIPLLAYEQGFTIDEVAVEHQPRKYGTSKYGFSKLWKDLPDMFTMIFLTKYSKRPFHFFGIIGGLLILAGSIILIHLTVMHYVFGEVLSKRPLLFFGMLLEIAGFQIFFTGFLADLIINLFQTSKLSNEGKPHFPIKYNSDKKEHNHIDI